jgi:hypothetical protein
VACLQSAAHALLGSYLTVAEVRDILTTTGVNIADTKVAITKPRINLDAAVADLPVPGVRSFTWAPVSSPQFVGAPFGVTVTARDGIGQPYAGFTGTVNLSGLIPNFLEATIGTGTATASFPMGTYYHDQRTQVIYLASEIGGARTLTSLSLYVGTTPGQAMNIWTIRMKHTGLSAYASASWDGAGWTTVYQSNQMVSTTGWVTFNLSTPFLYDGTSNLLVDFSFNNSSWTSSGLCRYSIPGGNRTIWYWTDSLNGDPLTWSGTTPLGTLSTNVPNIKLGATADFPIAITPTVSGSFVNGVWAGNVTVLETATGMLLRTDDGSGHKGDSNTFNVQTITPPVVTGQNPTAGATIPSASVDIDVTFSETVVGVDATDMVLGGAAAGGAIVAAPTNPGGTTWRFPVSGLVSGTLNISLAPDVGDIQDLDGNDLSPRPTTWNYSVSIVLPTDFGDAPAPYPTLLSGNGARHTIGALYLGAAIDAESDGQPQADALGDDSAGVDDEDGVVFVSPLLVGQTANVQVTASAPGGLDAWIDFNGDGDWADAGEQVFNNRSLGAGGNALTIGVPVSALATSRTFARFRLSAAGGLAPTGAAANGEVEDYAVAIGLAAPLMNAESAYTAGLSNSIGWTAPPGAEEYYAEYDTADTFPSPDASSGWIPGLSHTFFGLADGVTYHYRVKARHYTGASYIESPWSNVVASLQDATAPAVALNSGASNPTNLSPIPVTVTFTENVGGFEASDVVPGNGTVGNFQSVDAAHYTFDLTPTGQGLVTADIAAGMAQDAAGNPNTAAAQLGRVFDSLPPNASMASAAPDPTNTSPIPVTVTFTEDVIGFEASDVAPGNGTVSNFQTVDAAHYTFDLTPTDQGTVTANVGAGVAQDAAGNGNTSAAFSRQFNSIRPNVTMASTAPEFTATAPIPVTVTFDKNVTGFIASDIVPGNGTVQAFQTVDAAHYTFNLVPAGQGVVTADIADGVAEDIAYNLNWGAAQFSRTYDTVLPGVVMTSVAPDPTNTSPIPVLVTFTENASGFDAADIAPGNGTVGNFQTVDAAHYTFDLTPTGQGPVTADIAAGVAQDAAGNPSSAGAPFTRTYDSVLPGVAMTSAAPDPTKLSPISVTVTFTEDVAEFDAADIIPANAAVSNLQTVDAAHYTFDLTPAGQGAVTADIAAGAAHDAAGNPSTAGAQFARAYDNVPPDVTMSAIAPDPTNLAAIPVSVTFTENVSGFEALDILAGNGTVGNFQTVDAAHYTFDLTPADQGAVTADIAAGVAQDVAGNPNSPGVQFARTYDSVPPDAAMTSTAPDPTNASAIPVAVRFTENVSGFAAEDIVPGNAMVGNFQTVDAAQYTFDLLPIGEGFVTADIAAGVAQDAPGNPNTACVQFSRMYDSVPPGVVMTSTAPDPAGVSPIPVIVIFTEDVSGFTSGDIVPGDATVDNFQTVDAAQYTFDLTPAGQGLVTAEIAAGVAQDAAGNLNTAGLQFSRMFSSAAPLSELTVVTPTPTGADAVVFSVVFSEPVAPTFDASDVTPRFFMGEVLLTGAEVGTAAVTGTDPAYTVTVTVTNPDMDGLLDIAIGNGVSDPDGHPYAGGTSPSCRIYNWHFPYFTTEPAGARKYIDDSHAFAATANCGANTITYQWKWEDGSKMVWNGPTTPSWDLANLASANEAVYWCEASYDGVTHETVHAALEVKEHLEITQYPEDADKQVGDSHTFTVQTAGGYAPRNYVWKKLAEGSEEIIPDASEASYTIAELRESDAGAYTVEVTDANTDVRTASAVLTVTQGIPVTGVVGLAALLALLSIAGARLARARAVAARGRDLI